MLQLVRQLRKPQLFTRSTQACITITTRAFHKRYNAEREEQTIKLSDGRTLGFAEYGNPQGTPVFFLHGSPGCRYDGYEYIDVAEKLNLRIITPDRPGYGRSTVVANPKLSEYPKDIQQLAHHLRVSQYHVFGVSGGGPYAVACAYSLPREELLTASVIAGMAHPDMLTIKDDGFFNYCTLFLCKWSPGVLRAIVSWMTANDERFKRNLNKALKFHNDAEDEIVTDPMFQAALLPIMKEVYAQGAEGGLQDCQIYWGPWDFELKDVKSEVKLFFGAKDKRTPLSFGRHYKANLPVADLVEIEEMSHFNGKKFDEEILSRILGKWQPRREAERV